MKPDHGIVLSFHLGFWWEDVQKSVRSASRICNGAIWGVVVRGSAPHRSILATSKIVAKARSATIAAARIAVTVSAVTLILVVVPARPTAPELCLAEMALGAPKRKSIFVTA